MAQRDLNTTSYLILGLLVSRNWSAYEIAEQVGRGVAELWPRVDRQRYNTLKKLSELGLVEVRSEATGKRTRAVYSITTAGRRALQTWLTTEPHPSALEFEGMIRVLVAEQGTIDDLRSTLATVREQALERQALFSAHARYIVATDGGTFPEREHLMALVNRFCVGHFAHMAEWARWALEETASWADVSDVAAHHDRSREIFESAYGPEPEQAPRS